MIPLGLADERLSRLVDSATRCSPSRSLGTGIKVAEQAVDPRCVKAIGGGPVAAAVDACGTAFWSSTASRRVPQLWCINGLFKTLGLERRRVGHCYRSLRAWQVLRVESGLVRFFDGERRTAFPR